MGARRPGPTSETLLGSLEILHVRAPGAATPARRAADMAGELASGSGAIQIWSTPSGMSPQDWVVASTRRVLLLCGPPGEFSAMLAEPEIVAVEIVVETWETEATLFARSGLADLLGDPDGAPLVPAGQYAAASIAYAALAAMLGVHAKRQRWGQFEVARVDGVAVLAWLNWKAVAAAAGGQEIHREGIMAEWPVLRCADGHFALVFTERDWPSLVEAVGEEALADPRFATFAGRAQHRAEYLGIIGAWAAQRTRTELSQIFYRHAIPGAAVATPHDLLSDPLLVHRGAFRDRLDPSGRPGKVLVAPARVVARGRSLLPPERADPGSGHEPAARLALDGVRVLDLGVITAGAGTTAVLADLGAEVLKIESEGYPDPFRRWAGSDDSPLFKFNNRNKMGLSIDLKSPEGHRTFLDLLEGADVVVENFRRGVMDRLGLTFDTLRRVNPRILLASITSQGIDGPHSDHPSFGSTLEASSGLAALTCYGDGRPYISGRNLNFPDQIVCLYATAVIIGGLLHCAASGSAAHLDISQRDVAVYAISDVLTRASTGEPDDAPHVRARMSDHDIDEMFRSSDDRWVAAAVPVQKDLEELLGPGQRCDRIALSRWVGSRCAGDVESVLRAHGFGASIASTGADLLRAPSIYKGHPFAVGPDGSLVKGFPFDLLRVPLTIRADAPSLGQHTRGYVRGGQ